MIATDIGGTSFDVGLVVDGEPSYADTADVRQVPGRPAGARRDLDRRRRRQRSPGSSPRRACLKVGPRSAGAVPGPACYGRGGTEPTVTDANVVLGYIDPETYFGGRMPLNRDKAERAVREKSPSRWASVSRRPPR